MREMTPMQRVQTTIDRDIPDRVPVVLFFQSAAQHSMVRDDVTWFELLNDPFKLVRNVRQQHERYGADNLFLPLDFRITGEAFGGKCQYIMKSGGGMRMPVMTEFALRDASDIDVLEVPDPRTMPRCKVVLKAITELGRKYAGKVPIVGFLNSPPEAATDMIGGGYSAILPMMATEKGLLKTLLSKITEFNIEFGMAMLDAGAFGLASVGGGFNNLTISVDQYDEFVAPCHTSICRSLAAPYCLHQCQDATPFLGSMVGSGAGAIAFHEQVDLGMAKREHGSKVILAGNVGVSGSQSVMCNGSPHDVQVAAGEAMALAKEGGMFWLSGGCEIHHAVPEQNIYALVRSAEIFGRY